jgi:chromosome segregation ATPase
MKGAAMNDRDRFDEMRDQVLVVVESLRGDIRLLAEGHASLAGSIDDLRAGQGRLEAGQEKLEYGFAKLETRQGKLESGQDELRSSHAGLRGDVAELRGEMGRFRGEVREEFHAVRATLHSSHGVLDERVDRVERDVAILKRQIKGLGPRKGRS